MKFKILTAILVSSFTLCKISDYELENRKLSSITRSIEDGFAVYRDSNDNRVLFSCKPKEEVCFPVSVYLDYLNNHMIVQNNEGMILYILKTSDDGQVFATTSDGIVFCHKDFNKDKTISYMLDNHKICLVIKVIDENNLTFTDYTSAKPTKVNVTKENEIIKFTNENTEEQGIVLFFNENMLYREKDKGFKFVFKCFERHSLNDQNKLVTIIEILLISAMRFIHQSSYKSHSN